jgi:kynurenine formamidase
MSRPKTATNGRIAVHTSMLHAFRAFFQTLENDSKATDENQIIMFLIMPAKVDGDGTKIFEQLKFVGTEKDDSFGIN